MGFHDRWNGFFAKPLPNTILRFVIFFIGVYIIALSIALARTAGLGTSCIASIPNVMSYILPQLTIGNYQFILNVLLVLGQIVLNKSFKKPVELFQIIIVLFFSVFVDFNVYLLAGLPIPNYLVAWIYAAISIVLLSFGVVLELFADTVIMPGEGIVVSIANVTGKKFAGCKIAFDCANVAAAAILSLLAFGMLNGVREGTVATALFTGIIVGWLKKALAFIPRWIPGKPAKTIAEGAKTAENVGTQPTMSENEDVYPLVITISREYGSGGREIGRTVASKLGMRCYDEQMIELVAEQTGMTAAYVADHEEEVQHGLFYFKEYAFINSNPSQEDELYLAQTNVITDLCRDERCVFVGRMSNNILEKRPNCLHVFVAAPLDARIAHVREREGLDEADALKRIEEADAQRARRCKLYTGKTWGDVDNYDLVIDSAQIPRDTAAELIAAAAQTMALTQKTAATAQNARTTSTPAG